MKKIIFFLSFILFLPLAQASIYDGYPWVLQSKTSVPGYAPSKSVKIKEKKEEIKPAYGNILTDKIMLMERKRIMNYKNDWKLDYDYCFHRMYEENYNFCLARLEEQKRQCALQVTKGNNVYVDLNNQMLYAVKDCKLVLYTRVITGKNKTPSPTGHYKIYIERGPHFMQGEWYVNKAFYFRGGFALHDATWRNLWNWGHRAIFGSHGCINMKEKAMNVIWDNYGLGDTVHLYYRLPDKIAKELEQKTRGRYMIF